MANVELGMRVEAPVDRVWEFLCGPELGDLITSLYAEKAEFEETDKGLVVTTTLKDGGAVIRERINSLDNENKTMTYQVLDYGNLPYTNYQGEMRVMPAGEHACHLSFQCTYIPVGMTAEQSNQFWLEHNTEVMEKLKELIE